MSIINTNNACHLSLLCDEHPLTFFSLLSLHLATWTLTQEMTEHEELDTEIEDSGEIIALFGIDGPVGKHFVKLALSAGYHIRALSPTPVELEHEFLTVTKGDLNVSDSILEELLRHSTYVVCFLCDSMPKKDYPEGLLLNFIQRLYPMVKESPVRVFLYQVSAGCGSPVCSTGRAAYLDTSLCLIHFDSDAHKRQATSTTVDARGHAPMLANLVKFVKRSNFQKDQDSIAKFIGDNTEDWFYFILTRPGLTRETPSKKRLSASKSVSDEPVSWD